MTNPELHPIVPIPFVDATPDDEYPLRILRAFRHNCDVLMSSSSMEIVEDSPLIKIMNDMQRERAIILDKAIAILEGNNVQATYPNKGI